MISFTLHVYNFHGPVCFPKCLDRLSGCQILKDGQVLAPFAAVTAFVFFLFSQLQSDCVLHRIDICVGDLPSNTEPQYTATTCLIL